MKNLLILSILILPSFLISQQVQEIYKVVDEFPRFPGCEEADMSTVEKTNCAKEKMLDYIYTNLSYPEAARDAKVEGIVVVQFVVDIDGSIDDAKIVREIGGGCGAAALDIVTGMNKLSSVDTIVSFHDDTNEEEIIFEKKDLKWRAGHQDGKAVKVLYTLPVRFKLQDDDVVSSELTLMEPKSATDNDDEVLNWMIHPPEYTSYQSYKDQMLIPSQIKIAYQTEPIDPTKVVGDIIPFGKTVHPIKLVAAKHNGIDFRAVPGVAVKATADGTIAQVTADHDTYGQYIKIKHNDRTESLYAHLSATEVAVGDLVKAGQIIGAVGMSGAATYPHLHYEILVERQTVDPQLDQMTRINASEPLNHPKMILENNKSPLIVLNGIVQEATFSLEQINTNDIKGIKVLKGEKAMNKYGDKANAGVIEVTTADVHVEKLDLQKTTTLIEFGLEQNYPNPVKDQTTITFNLPSAAPASLYFYSQTGEFLYSLNEGFNQGFNQVSISAADLQSNGTIYYFLIQGHMTATKQMVVLH